MSKIDWKSGWVKAIGGFLAGFVPLVFSAAPAFADGIPHVWGLGMQTPGSEIASRINSFHNFLLYIIGAVSVFVLILLIYVVARYNKYTNAKPAKTTHNVKLEIIWTAVPCLIVLSIAWISFPLLYFMDRMPNPDLTLKVTGHQWYWSYEYPDTKVAFDSMAVWGAGVNETQAAAALKDSEAHWLIKDRPLRMLEVDNRVVLPVGKVVRIQITGSDVEHSWFVPSLGVNRMAVPGRLNEVWFKIDKPGLYYGQCSMICGNGHGYMPIVIEGVTPDQFATWAASHKAAQAASLSSVASAQ